MPAPFARRAKSGSGFRGPRSMSPTSSYAMPDLPMSTTTTTTTGEDGDASDDDADDGGDADDTSHAKSKTAGKEDESNPHHLPVAATTRFISVVGTGSR